MHGRFAAGWNRRAGDRVETRPNSHMGGSGARQRRVATTGPSQMQTVIIVIHLMIVSAMIGLVLLQRSEGGGLGMGGGGGGFLTSRGTSNVLTRTTAILAAAFFVTSLVLSILAGFDRKPRSILQGNDPAAPTSQPATGRDRAARRRAALLDRLQGRRRRSHGAAVAVEVSTGEAGKPGLVRFWRTLRTRANRVAGS